jgi:PAS domain S-box-containing protein
MKLKLLSQVTQKFLPAERESAKEIKLLLALLTKHSAALTSLQAVGGEAFLQVVAALLENGSSLLITDPDGKIEYVNPTFEAMTGYSRKEVLGQKPSILKSGKQEARFYEEMWKTLLNGQTFSAELVNKRKNGDFYYQQETILPIKDDDGQILHLVSIGRDVTAERQEEKKLAIIGKIATPIINQIHSPIQQIQAASYRLRNYVVKQKALQPYHDLEMIYQTGTEIEQTLSILKNFTEPSTAPRAVASLTAMVTSVIAQLQAELTARGATIAVDCTSPGCQAVVNAREWEFILFEFLHHAVEGLPSRRRQIRLEITDRGHESAFAIISPGKKLLNQVLPTCQRYTRIPAGEIDLEFLLAEKLIGDYNGTVTYQISNQEQKTVILLPQPT